MEKKPKFKLKFIMRIIKVLSGPKKYLNRKARVVIIDDNMGPRKPRTSKMPEWFSIWNQNEFQPLKAKVENLEIRMTRVEETLKRHEEIFERNNLRLTKIEDVLERNNLK